MPGSHWPRNYMWFVDGIALFEPNLFQCFHLTNASSDAFPSWEHVDSAIRIKDDICNGEETKPIHLAKAMHNCEPRGMAFRAGITTIIVDLGRIKSSKDIPTVEWKQFCQSIKMHSRNLISLKMIGPLNCFIGDARVEYNMNKYGFGARNDPCCPSASKLKCLLMATPNLQRLHLERIGDCEEIFWEIRWLAPKLERYRKERCVLLP